MSMNNNIQYEHIPQEKFVFTQLDASLHDKKLETKSRSYLADAFLRFRKNKSSVIAAIIIAFLLLYAIVAPFLVPYNTRDMDKIYVSYPPYVESIAEKGWGILDGGVTRSSQNERSMLYWRGIAEETGMDPVLKVLSEKITLEKVRGKMVERSTKTIENNQYYEKGIISQVISYEEFAKIQAWQNETGIQVIYPAVDPKDIKDISDANVWYEVKDQKGEPKLDKNGNFIPAYLTDASRAGAEYNSIRIPGDDGSYVYSLGKSGAVSVRLCYYNYYTYLHDGQEPMYIMGTNSLGQDIFSGIGIGARFSIIFAIIVSAINLFIGAIYGAIEGYYGGAVDMTMERISDILAGLPFVVCTTLFQLHLAQKVGVVPSFLFAFVLTGWIGMASLTRKQFYRFKNREFVLAARTLGASDKRLMFKHIFPNSIGTIITSCALVIPGVINSETSMTYLGIINLQEFAGTSLGTLMSQGNAAMTTAPHAMFWPALYLSLLLICFNLFGNGLRDAFNPSTRGGED